MEIRLKSVSDHSRRIVFKIMITIMIIPGILSKLSAIPDDWSKQINDANLSSWNFYLETSGKCEEDMALESSAVALSCLPYVNISLGQNGSAVLTALTLVNAPDYPANLYIVDIMGPLTNTVYCEQLGQELMVVVTEVPTGNSCMSTIFVEDKLRPVLVCTSDILPCNVDIGTIDFESYIESATDNCDDNLTLWHSYVIQNLPCNPERYTQQILVTWTATDDSGNSSTCQDIIYLQKPALGLIDFPPNISVSCVNYNIDPSITGEPSFNGEPIDHNCQFVVFHNDVVIPMCNGSKKILRTWTVMDWCVSGQVSDVQEILIVDNTPPNITCPANVTIGTSLGICTANYTLPVPLVSDDCANSNQIVVTITVAGIPGIFIPGQVINLGIGTTLITMRATDPCGNSRVCYYTVTVKDNTPPIPICNGITVGLGPDGMAIVVADLLGFQIIENCGILSKQVWRMSNNCNNPGDLVPGPDVKFCCADIGQTVTVAFKVTDLSGNMNTCMFQVTVKDQLPPTVVCKDVTISVTGQGSIIVTPAQVEQSSSDNCQIISRTVTPNTFDCSDIGDHVVTLTVTDQSGNTATCTATVTIVDVVPPVAICRNITVSVDNNGEVTIVTAQINNGSTDNCAIDTMFLNDYYFDCDDEGPNIVTLTVTDFSGNTSTCTATVTVLTAPPVALCKNITVSLDANGNVTITGVQIDNGSTDDCGIATLTVNPSNFDCTDIGVNVVTLTVTDISGNTSTCTANVTVQDNMPPNAQCQSISVMLDDNGMATITAADINDGSTDNCSIISLSVTPTNFDCQDVGNNIVVLTVTDQSGNTSTCTANVMVLMPDPPVALCQDITVTLGSNGTVTINPLDVDDGSSTQCGDLTFDVNPDLFNCDDIGEVNIVTLTVTDETGTTATCTATVTVLESPPIAICKNITVSLDANGVVTITASQINNNSTDDCGIATYSVVPDDFNCDDIGEVNIVTLTVTDFSGLSSTCTAIVTVVDVTPPVAICQNITISLDGNGNATITAAQIDNGSTDNCFIETISVTPANFDCADVGNNVVTLTVTDQSGNSSTCTAIVTVTSQPPVAQCQDITVSLGPNGLVVITPDQIDNGSGSGCGNLDFSLDENTFDCTELGTNIVILTVTDGNNNSSTCTATVTVVDDDAPLCDANDITVFLDGMGNASITADQINDNSTDNCTITTISVTPTSFNCSNIGPNVVTLTVTDQSGNSSTCTAIVTVIDNILPNCLTINITVSVNGNGMVTILPSQVDGGSTDNCGPPNLSVFPNTFDCDDLGVQVVVLTVTDDSGNSSTCTASVTVTSDGGLQAICQNVTIFLDANGNASVDPADIDNGSGGGCEMGDLTFDLSQTDFNCTDLGPNIVVLTVTDENGATSTCTAIVTVVDLIPPVISCPANLTVDCHLVNNPENTSQFGAASATDNCPGVIVTETHVININNCGIGTILRTFTATDASGNTATCTQLVTISNPDPLDAGDITWPNSPVTVNICNSTLPQNIPNGVPVIAPSALLCVTPVVTFSDQVQMFVDNDPNTLCRVITRTWTVTDNCQPATFTFVQTINVTDMVPPLFVNINDMTKVANSNCVANFTLIASASDCAGVTITNNSPYGVNNGSNASGDYPVGVTVVLFTATDGCGNISTMDVVITVTDSDPTDFLCEKLIVILPPETEITIAAHFFVTFLLGGCTDENDFVISYSRTMRYDTLRTYDCGDVGVHTFSLYFWSASNNILLDSCTTADLDLRDPSDFCQDGLVLFGNVDNEDGLPIGNVEVSITNAPMIPDTTNHIGQYQIEGLNEGVGYNVAPFNDQRHREGVSTLDLVLIQKHLLGKAKLNSPYKMIAADANNSGHLTALDLIEIRKLILGINNRFPNNTSWRFIDMQYSFPDPYNPFSPGFPEAVWIDSVSEGVDTADFIGVKIGDVNGSYFLSRSSEAQIEPRSESLYELKIQRAAIQMENKVNWEIVALAGQGPIDGMQFSVYVGDLAIDQIKEIHSDLLTADQWWYNPDTRTINVSWSSGHEEDLTGKVILSAGYRDMPLEHMEIETSKMEAEAYVIEKDEVIIRKINVTTDGIEQAGESNYHLFQNVPNPFHDGTLIRFAVPKEENVRLVIHDLAGRQIFVKEIRCTAGLNEFALKSKDLGTSGIYYYTLYTLNASFTRKMSYTNY